MKKKILLLASIITIFFFSNSLFAQWECPSKLGGFLTPLYEGSNLAWAIEGNVGIGVLDSNSIKNAKFFMGVDYSNNNHSFYFEGGYKGWGKENLETEILIDGKKFGLRELFYKYYGLNTQVSFGFQTTEGVDYFLLSDRAYSAVVTQYIQKFRLNIVSGSVTKDFAKNGSFGSKCFIYDIDRERVLSPIGNSIGETNFLHITFSFLPNRDVPEPQTTNYDEFSTEEDEFSTDDDEFSSVGEEFSTEEGGLITSEGEFSTGEDEFSTDEDEFSSEEDEFSTEEEVVKTNPFFTLEEVGGVFYDEFGSMFGDNKIFGGLFAELKLPMGLSFKSEVLYQNVINNNAIIYFASLYKDVFWKSPQRTTFIAKYYGMYSIDANAKAMMSFSNIYAGEVFRLDAIDMPIFLFALRHSLTKYKLRFKLQYAQQLGKENMREYDFKISKKLWHYIDINTHFAYLESDNLPEATYLARLVLRVTY